MINKTCITMRFKSLFILSMAAGMLLLGSCTESSSNNKLYDDWWPIHASGSMDDGYFTASWNGDLDSFGAIGVIFTSKTDPNLTYNQFVYYKALSFSQERKAFCYIDISTRDYKASKYLDFYIKSKKIYFEKLNDVGRGNGEYEEGQDFKFLDNDHIQIGTVQYERYSVYYENRVRNRTSEYAPVEGRIPVMIYE